MATTIEQKPLYNPLPVGQDIIFTLSNSTIVTTYYNVKFVAEVFISGGVPPNTNVNTDLIGTFKAAPNNAGVGMFDFSAVVENYVKADNLAAIGSYYKTSIVTATSQPVPPLHLIDKYSKNNHAIKWLTIKFSVEGSTTLTGIPTIIAGEGVNSIDYRIFNGYLKHTDQLEIFGNDFGYDTTGFQLINSTSSFLTNAPTTQYANVEDYGTIGFIPVNANLSYITCSYKDSSGGSLGFDQVMYGTTGLHPSSTAGQQLHYFGCYPANLQNWSATFAAAIASGISYYTVQAFDNTATAISQLYTINVNCPDLKNYEPIRIAWLNQWGALDYYTFTKKSTRTTSTQGSTYTQLEGTWNESAFRLNGYRGGKKAFRVNATEKIKMNTDFVNEAESEWFEELINSPEVYLLTGYGSSGAAFDMLNTYVTPVRLTTSSYTRKTIANDRLMQYTFEVEKSKTLRTQAV